MSEDQANTIIVMLREFKRVNEKQHDEIIEHQKTTNGNVKENTTFRFKFMGGFGVIKFILGFVGIGNIIILFKLFS